MSKPITVTTAVKFRRLLTPNFVTQDGSQASTMHVRELPQQVLDALAGAWLDDIYSKAGQRNPFTSRATEPNDD